MSVDNVEDMEVCDVAGQSLDSVKKGKKKNISVSVGGFYGGARGKFILDDVSCSSDGDSDDDDRFPLITLGDSVVIVKDSDIIGDKGREEKGKGKVLGKGKAVIRPNFSVKRKRKTTHYYDYSDSDSDSSSYESLYNPNDTVNSDSDVDDPSPCAPSSPNVSASATTSSAPTTSVVVAGTSGTTSSGSQPVGPSIDEAEHPVQQQKGRNRVSTPELWAANVAKRKKNLGLSYESRVKKTGTKKTIPAKKVGPPCNCKNKCFSKVGGEAINVIIKCYWSMGDYNLQTAYLQRNIRRVPIKRKRTKDKESKKKWTLTYSVTFNGKLITICKTAFLSIHAITAMRTQVAMEKLSEGGTTIKDLRGQNPNTRKITGAVLECVHEHIKLLPVCSSHYTRTHTPNRQYLESHLTIRALYEKYHDWMFLKHRDVAIVKLKYYNKIFSRHYNIGFCPVKKDTCNTCERLTKALLDGTRAGTSVAQLELEQQEHSKKISVACNAMKAAKLCDEAWVCVAMDLQQTMPCPRLSVSSAYYKRKLWLYNFCVHDIRQNESYMYVWEEHVAARGSVEIASCLVKWLGDYIINNPDHPKNLRIFADNCGGQNKNIVMILALLREVHLQHFDRIELCYLVSGHSYMACDRSFGVIERNIRKYESIMIPQLYCEKIARSRKKKRFPLYHMTREDFLDFGSFITTKQAVKRSVGGKQFQNAAQIINCNYRQGYILKKAYDVADNAGTRVSVVPPKVSVASFNLGQLPLPPKYSQDRQLQPTKLADLESLMQYMGYLESAWLRDLIALQHELYGTGTAEDVSDHTEEPDDPESDQLYDYDAGVRYIGGTTA